MSTLTPAPSEGTPGDTPPPKGFAQLSYVLLADPAISPTEKVVLAALLRFAWRSGQCFPAGETIAVAAGLSARTVGRVLPQLAAKGLISIEPTRANPTRRVIVLDFMANPALHPEKAPRVGLARRDKERKDQKKGLPQTEKPPGVDQSRRLPLPRQPVHAVTRPSCPPPYAAKVAEEEFALEETSEKTAGRPLSLERPTSSEAPEPRESDRLTGPELATFRRAIECTTGQPVTEGSRMPQERSAGGVAKAPMPTPGSHATAKPVALAPIPSGPILDRLAAVHRGCSSRAVTEAADSLVRELGDPSSRLGFLRVLNDVRSGVRAKGVLHAAYQTATAGRPADRGRRFLAAATSAPPPGSVLARLGLDPGMLRRGAT